MTATETLPQHAPHTETLSVMALKTLQLAIRFNSSGKLKRNVVPLFDESKIADDSCFKKVEFDPFAGFQKASGPGGLCLRCVRLADS